eukprot:TRINITY_DN4291_c0_g1_i1.p1 TRINITY_DN4291_c0_g1~~TRINITY_DN4291_c0_g1_i1.p1  ORF type:complete len:417 (+),score=50.23 TRINITY_DN4291_c0_g1_i1:72-1322(+)
MRMLRNTLFLLSFVIGCIGIKYQAEVLISTTQCSLGDSLLLEFEEGTCSQIDNAGAFAGRLPDMIKKLYVEIEITDQVNSTVNVYIPLLSDPKCNTQPTFTADLASGVCQKLDVGGLLSLYLEIQNISVAEPVVNPSPSGEIVTNGFVANVGFEEGFFTNSNCTTPTMNLAVPQADYCYKPQNTDYYYQLNCFVPDSTSKQGTLVYSVSNDSSCGEQTTFQGLPISFPNSVVVTPGTCKNQYVNMSLDSDSILSALEPVRVWSGACTPQINCSRIVECGNETDIAATPAELKSCSMSGDETGYCLLPLIPQYCGWAFSLNSTTTSCPEKYRLMSIVELSLCDFPLSGSYCIPSHVKPAQTTPAPKEDDDSNIVPIIAAVIVVVVLFVAIVCICKFLNRQNAHKNSDGLDINMVHAE